MQYYFLKIKSNFWLFAAILVVLAGLIALPAAFAYNPGNYSGGWDDRGIDPENTYFDYVEGLGHKSATISNGTYTSTKANQAALLVENISSTYTTLDNPIVSKTGSDSNSIVVSGNNSGLVVVNGGGLLTINGGQITTSGSDSNAIYLCTGFYECTSEQDRPARIALSSARISTSGTRSNGIFTVDESEVSVQNSTIETTGDSSSAIVNYTDNSGSGASTLTISGGTYTSKGTNSPTITTADTNATISGATISSTKTSALHLYRNNNFTVTDSNITANNVYSEGTNAVVVMQAGPDKPSSATFNGGSITATSGSVFCSLGAGNVINLNGVAITNSSTNQLVYCKYSGSNESLTINASHQTMSGEIAIPTSGIYTINLTDSSNFTGAIKNASAENTVGNVTMDSSSTWTLTDHTTIDSLTDADTGYCNINFNGYELRVGSSITPSLITQSSTCNESPSPDPAPTPINVTASVLSHDDAPAGGSIGDFTSTAVAGETITVNFIPAEGYAVANVYANSINVTSQLRGNTLYLTAGDSDLSIVVEFQKTQFTVNVIGSHIGVVPSGATAVVASGELTVYIGDPDHGYYLDSVTVNGADQTASVADGKLKLDNITADLTVIIVAKRITYQPLDGNNQVFIIGQNAGKLRFSFDVDYSKFETGGQVYIDNVLLGEQHYTSMSGSTIIDVDSSVFDDLEPGEHTLSATFNDGGIATAKFTVLSSAGATTPDTGEFTAGIAGAIVSFTALPLLVFGGYYLIRWRKQNKPVKYY